MISVREHSNILLLYSVADSFSFHCAYFLLESSLCSECPHRCLFNPLLVIDLDRSSMYKYALFCSNKKGRRDHPHHYSNTRNHIPFAFAIEVLPL